jgi:FkbM family methyltransferase
MTGWVARKALAAVAHAPFYEPLLTEWCAGPVRVIPLAYTGFADASPTQVQHQNGRVGILTVGTINPNKRVESVIQTIARSAVLRTRCEYDVIGKIEARERIRLLSLIDQLGLHDRVHLHGAVSDFELRWRYAEAQIVCCLRWPALEGASASCIEAMSYGKAVIVTDAGFYASIPPDRVMKVKPTHESQDLTRHLEMLVVDAGERESLGKRALEWARFEYAPDAYAARIEPLLEAAVEGRPATDALVQIGANLRAMSENPDEPIVQQVGSEFRSLFCGTESCIDAIKWISNMLQEPATPPDFKQHGDELQPALGDIPAGAPLSSQSEGEEPASRLPPVSENAAAGAPLKSRSDSEQSPGELQPHSAAVPAGSSMRRFVGHCTEPVRSRLKRYSLRHFLFRCAEPVLSHLRGYFLGDLSNLTNSGIQRIANMEQSIERFIGALRQQEDAIQKHSERLVCLEDIAVMARRLPGLESQFGNAKRLIELLVNRHVLVLRNELLARTPHGYLFAPIDDPCLATFLSTEAPWEQEVSALLDLILKAGMTFIDIGANVGFHALHGARVVGLGGAVIAFEPAPKAFQLLQRSVHLNGLGAICRCINLALSASEGLAALHVSTVSGHNSLYPLGGEKKETELQIKTARLDSVLVEAQRIDVVKIDVAGAELDVLEGMKHILANHRDIVLIVEYGVSHLKRLGISPADWFRRFFTLGFVLFAFDEQADAWREIAEQRTSDLPSGNVVFVRPGTSPWSILVRGQSKPAGRP